MREIQASEAKARFAQLLREVENGETVAITRHGQPIAHILPARDHGRDEIRRAVESIRAARKKADKITVEEILAMRDEGRKY